MKLVPIQPRLDDNLNYPDLPECQQAIEMSVGYYELIGYNPPWVCYLAEKEGKPVGTCAFKGPPSEEGKVEIAYGVFKNHQGKGIGTEICRELTMKSLTSDPSVIITALTLPETNSSTRILEKNGFVFSGVVEDPEDGKVWEWTFRGLNRNS